MGALSRPQPQISANDGYGLSAAHHLLRRIRSRKTCMRSLSGCILGALRWCRHVAKSSIGIGHTKGLRRQAQRNRFATDPVGVHRTPGFRQ